MNNRAEGDADRDIRRMNRRTALALDILKQVSEEVKRGMPADASLQSLFRQHKEYGSRDRRFYGGLVFSFFRWKGWMDGIAPERACGTALLLDSEILSDDTRKLCEGAGISPGHIRPLAALPLKDKAAIAGSILGRRTAVEDVLPGGLLDRIAFPRHREPDDARMEFLSSMQLRPPTWLRFTSPADAVAFPSEGKTVHPRIPTAVALPENFNRGLLNTPEGMKADVQDLSSQCVGLIAAPGKNEHWWDACAGGGGKALHLAALTAGEADILASDTRASSLDQLKQRAARTGLRGLRAAVLDGTKDNPGRSDFDGIIVDAPCSGIGTWPRNPDARWRFDAAAISASAAKQKRIMRNACQFLRPGGRLIYAVCTCTVDETEAVVSSFLNEQRNYEPADFLHPLTGDRCRGQCMIWPADGPCNGMFIAVFRKS